MEQLTIKRDDHNVIIGDDLVAAFWKWCEATGPVKTPPRWGRADWTIFMFCRWLIETGPGQEALRNIGAMPRQLWLDFLDREPPWETTAGYDRAQERSQFEQKIYKMITTELGEDDVAIDRVMVRLMEAYDQAMATEYGLRVKAEKELKKIREE